MREVVAARFGELVLAHPAVVREGISTLLVALLVVACGGRAHDDHTEAGSGGGAGSESSSTDAGGASSAGSTTGGDGGAGADTSGSTDAGGSGGGVSTIGPGDCGIPTCERANECAPSCREYPSYIGCCPCPDGLVDQLVECLDELGCGRETCDEDQFCRKEVGQCDEPDVFGSCVSKGIPCPEDISPVCGCDGMTYSNGCEAVSAGVNIASEEACD